MRVYHHRTAVEGNVTAGSSSSSALPGDTPACRLDRAVGVVVFPSLLSLGVPPSAFASAIAAPLIAPETDCCRDLFDVRQKAGIFRDSQNHHACR